MRHKPLSAALILAVLAALAACRPPSNIGVTQMSSEPSPARPTETLIPTATATPSPYPPTPSSQPTPDLFHSSLAQDILFGGDATCKLPCWYGLQVGKSRVEEVQLAFRNALGTSPDYVFAMGDTPQSSGGNSNYVIYSWQEDNTSATHLFSIKADFNPQTQILSDLRIYSTHPFFLDRAKPQQVLKELGAPPQMWILFQITERADVASLRVEALYPSEDRPEDTIYISWMTGIPVHQSQDPNNSYVAEWCLNGASDQTDHSFMLRIPPDFDLATTDMRSYHYVSLEEVFGITPDALYQLVMKEDNTCLSYEF